MARYHLKFRNFNEQTIAAAEELFSNKPWRMEWLEGSSDLFQAFVNRLSEIYETPEVQVHLNRSSHEYSHYNCDSIDGFYLINLPSVSILRLFTGFRKHMLNTIEDIEPVDGPDPLCWGTSLFYSVRPKMFRARVREGRIFGMTAEDTYSRTSWQRLLDANLADLDGTLLCTNREAHQFLLNESIAVNESESGEAESQTAQNDGLDMLSRDQIRALARENNIVRGNRNRAELIEALRERGVTWLTRSEAE